MKTLDYVHINTKITVKNTALSLIDGVISGLMLLLFLVMAGFIMLLLHS